jgi:hypothetical protein
VRAREHVGTCWRAERDQRRKAAGVRREAGQLRRGMLGKALCVVSEAEGLLRPEATVAEEEEWGSDEEEGDSRLDSMGADPNTTIWAFGGAAPRRRGPPANRRGWWVPQQVWPRPLAPAR